MKIRPVEAQLFHAVTWRI